MPAPCPNCSEPLAAGAKFCPRCGNAVTATTSPVTAPRGPTELGKISAPLPRGGMLFLLALVLAPAAIIAGLVLGVKAFIYVGVALAVILVVLLVLGTFF